MEEVQIISTLDNTDTIKGLQETEKEVVKTSRSLKTLTDRQKELNEAFEEAEPGDENYRRLQKELVAVNREIKNTELSLEALDTDQVASEIGGLVGGLTDVASGAVLAFGVSQESAEEFLQTFAQIEGAGRVVKGSIEGVQAGLKLYNNLVKTGALATRAQAVATTVLGAAQTAYNAIVGTSTGLLKAFRIALVSTGIGALIVGIGLLISNFEAVSDFISGAVDALGSFKEGLLFILGPIALLVAAYDALFGAVEDQIDEEAELERRRREQSQANSARTKKRIEEIKEEQSVFIQAKETENTALERRIQILENNGEASDALTRKILENNAAVVQSELNAVSQIIQAKEEQFRREQEIRGLTEEEFSAILAAQGIDVQNLRDRSNEVVEGLQSDLELAQSEITKFDRDQQQKRNDQAKKAADERAKIEEDLLKRRIAAQAEIDQILRDSIEDETEREIANIQARYDKRLETLSTEIPEEQLLIKTLTQQLEDDITRIQTQAQNERLQQEFENQQTLNDLRIQLLEGRVASELEQFNLDRQIADARFQFELDTLNNELQQKEITEEEARLRREILEQEHQNELTRIAQEAEEQRVQSALDEANRKIDTVQFFADSASAINDAFNQIQENQLKEGEELSLKQQRRRFNREKAFNIAQAAINTAQGITQAIAQFGPPPSPLGIAGIAAASAVGAAQIAAIATQRFNPSGGGSSAGASATTGFSPSVAAGGNNQPAIPTTQTGQTNIVTQNEAAGSNQQTSQNNQPIQAYVLTNPLADAFDASKAIEAESTL